jgi:hypothetical protein
LLPFEKVNIMHIVDHLHFARKSGSQAAWLV